MTTIVYRDGVMAADSKHTVADWGVPWTSPKMRRVTDGSGRELIVGFAGNPYQGDQFCAWLQGKEDRPDLGDESAALVVEVETRRVWKYAHKGALQLTSEFVVVGSGMPPALGALHAGASAEEAVRIAGLIDPSTGGEILVERL